MVERTVGADPAERLRIGVVVGSVREGRVGESVAKWFATVADQRSDLEIDLIDLAEASLPAVLPESDDEIPAAVPALGERLRAADGFVVVTPEYNHSFPASLKHAVDWFFHEWGTKPVSFVSYGGRARGIRAVEQLRQVFPEVHAITTREALAFDLMGDELDDNGWPRASEASKRAAHRLLEQLTWWARASREARARRPYPG